MSQPVQLEGLRAIFDAVDIDGNGYIDASEIGSLLESRGLLMDEERMAALRRAVVDGHLSFDEVVAFVKLANLANVFDLLDADHNGYVDGAELRSAFKSQLGVELTQEELVHLFHAVDKDPDGKITFEEFSQFFGHMENMTSGPEDMLYYLQTQGSSYDMGNSFSPSTGSLSSTSALGGVLRTWVAGASGGLVSRSFLAPLDLVMIIQQTSRGKTARHIVSETIRRSGWTGLYRGNGAALLKTVPFSGLVCASYVPLVRQINEDSPWAWYQRVFAGGAAGFVSTIITHPLDTARARLAVTSRRQAGGLWQVLARGGYYNGLSATLLTMSTFIGVQQASYDRLTYEMQPQNGFQYFGAGIMAGALASASTHPIDTIRRTLQIQSKEEHTNSRQVATEIYQTAGIKGFYRGFLPSVVKLAPSVGLALIVRDYVLGRI